MVQERILLSNTPLVSIVVITYNSAQYVLETLESTKAQTYRNIELIITDDYSTDNTIEVCRIWINENKNGFVRAEIITAIKNSGISANCNRGAKKAEGKWIKFIAGDDILLPDCVQNFINFTYSCPSAEVIISKQQSFNKLNGVKVFVNIRPQINDSNKLFYKESADINTQYYYLLNRKVLIAGPAYIIKRDLLSTLDYFNEQYRLLEDYPLFLKILEKGNQIYFLDKVTVEYRLHENAVSQTDMNGKIYPEYYKDWFSFLMHYNLKRLKLLYKVDLLLEYSLYKAIMITGNKGIVLRYLNDNFKKFLPVHLVAYFNKNK
jgi:glycosyltransferase involved in cell wall biosynthesis